VRTLLRSSGGSRWRCCAQPSWRPLLVFIFDFTKLGVILLLGGPGFSTLEVGHLYPGHLVLQYAVGSLAFTDQLLCTLAFSILYSRMIPRTVVSVGPAHQCLTRPHGLPQRYFVGGLSILLLVFLRSTALGRCRCARPAA